MKRQVHASLRNTESVLKLLLFLLHLSVTNDPIVECSNENLNELKINSSFSR